MTSRRVATVVRNRGLVFQCIDGLAAMRVA
jgi:hypothetical protein